MANPKPIPFENLRQGYAYFKYSPRNHSGHFVKLHQKGLVYKNENLSGMIAGYGPSRNWKTFDPKGNEQFYNIHNYSSIVATDPNVKLYGKPPRVHPSQLNTFDEALRAQATNRRLPAVAAWQAERNLAERGNDGAGAGAPNTRRARRGGKYRKTRKLRK